MEFAQITTRGNTLSRQKRGHSLSSDSLRLTLAGLTLL